MDRVNIPDLEQLANARRAPAELPSLWQLRVFETVARLENVTRASQELLRSQPATTCCIGNFEAELGVTLFRRSTTGIYLTPAGVAMLARTRKILSDAESAIAEVVPPGGKLTPRALASRITRTQMRCLIAIAECRSFRCAARMLGITEASLQRAARTLEENLGVCAYRRTSAGFAPTEAGATFARRLKMISEQIRALTEAARTYEPPRARCVTVGVLLLDPTSLIVAAIRELHARYPDARVVVLSGTYEQLANKLLREEIDFMIGVLKHPDAAFGFEEEPLHRERYRIAARTGHPLTRSRPIDARELGNYAWVLPPKGSPRREAYEHIFVEGSPPPALIETYSLSTIRITLTDSDMLTVLSAIEMLSEERFGFLTALPIDIQWDEPVVGITRVGKWTPNEVQSAFLDSIRRNAVALHEPARAALSENE